MISIRKATDEDASSILECLSAAFAEYREKYTSDAFADTVLTPEAIAQRLREMTLFVAPGNPAKRSAQLLAPLSAKTKATFGEWRLFLGRKEAASQDDCSCRPSLIFGNGSARESASIQRRRSSGRFWYTKGLGSLLPGRSRISSGCL